MSDLASLNRTVQLSSAVKTPYGTLGVRAGAETTEGPPPAAAR